MSHVSATPPERRKSASPSHETVAIAVPAQHETRFFRGVMIAVPLSLGLWVALYIMVRALT